MGSHKHKKIEKFNKKQFDNREEKDFHFSKYTNMYT